MSATSPAQALVDRGIAAEESGAAGEALALYREAIALDPRFAPAHMNLGIALEAAGEHVGALAAYQRAIALDPDYAAAHYNLGLAHLADGQNSHAQADFHAALQSRADFPEAWVGLAEALQDGGREDEALDALNKAIGQREHYAGALFNAGVLLRKMGRIAEAEKRLHEFAQAQARTAAALQSQGRRTEAVRLLFGSLASLPASTLLRQSLAGALYGAALGMASEKERGILASLCEDDAISTLFLATAVASLFKGDAAFSVLRMAARDARDPFGPPSREVEMFVRSQLVLSALPRMTLMDAEVEVALTHVRRSIIMRFDAFSDSADPAVPFEFVCALARQCFYSGYAFFETGEERRRVQDIRASLQGTLEDSVSNPRAHEASLSVAALYDSLSSLPGCERLLEHSPTVWSEAFRPIVQEQLSNRRRERELSPKIPAITTISDAVSLAVRSQYEESPYPLWVSVQQPEQDTFEALSRRHSPQREVRTRVRPVPMLIAGCGTGHHPIQVARAHPDSEILAVDLSLASLAYAARMAERFGISNITFAQADILNLGELGRRFAVVECAGVLHHLRDPMQGWKVLAGLVEPDGLMRIALYSEKARAGIRAARQFLQPLGLVPTPEGIRRCRRAIIELPDGHQAKDVLTFGDFFTLNGCRDLVMHVQEHNFTLPRIGECLDELGLQFLGMECDTQTESRFVAMFPATGARTDLGAWHRFEEKFPLSFKSMYQFWCCKKE